MCVSVRAVSSEQRQAVGAVGCLGAGDVVVLVRGPEEHIVDDQDERSHRYAEEIGDRQRDFHPDLSWHVGVFGPQLPGVARPPLHVPVQLLRRHGALPAGRFHLGINADTVSKDFPSADCCVFIWVRTAEPDAPLSSARLFSPPERDQDAVGPAAPPVLVLRTVRLCDPCESSVRTAGQTELMEADSGSIWWDRCQAGRGYTLFPVGTFKIIQSVNCKKHNIINMVCLQLRE